MLRGGKKKDAPAAAAPGGSGGGAGGSGMDDDVGALGRGSRVWYRADATTWRLAELREPPGGAGTGGGAAITLLAGADAGRPVDGVPADALMPANPDVQATIPDLTQLSYLNEPAILGNLAARYGEDAIYTNAGPVLIALNPCKELPLYSDEVQHDYKSEQASGVKWSSSSGGERGRESGVEAVAISSSGSGRQQAASSKQKVEPNPQALSPHRNTHTPRSLLSLSSPLTPPNLLPPQPSRTSRCTRCRRTSTPSRAPRTARWCARARASRS